jgi:hypothetical protein
MTENVARSLVFSDSSYAGKTIHYWHLWRKSITVNTK